MFEGLLRILFYAFSEIFFEWCFVLPGKLYSMLRGRGFQRQEGAAEWLVSGIFWITVILGCWLAFGDH